MRVAGSNPTVLYLLQTYCVSILHASPHPALRATFPPGEGKRLRRKKAGRKHGPHWVDYSNVKRIWCQTAPPWVESLEMPSFMKPNLV